MKKFKLRHPTEKLLIFIVILLIGLLAAILWFYGQRINILWQQNSNNFNPQSGASAPVGTDVKFYIQNALKGLYPLQAVTDPLQGRVYIPEMRLSLPIDGVSRTLVYGYIAKSQYNPQMIMVSSSQLVNALPNTFSDVSCLQQHIDVAVNEKNDSGNNGAFEGQEKLSDGRILYFFQPSNPDCNKNFWTVSPVTPTKILNLLKQAQSY